MIALQFRLYATKPERDAINIVFTHSDPVKAMAQAARAAAIARAKDFDAHVRIERAVS